MFEGSIFMLKAFFDIGLLFLFFLLAFFGEVAL
jgi:hypothetical protein